MTSITTRRPETTQPKTLLPRRTEPPFGGIRPLRRLLRSGIRGSDIVELYLGTNPRSWAGSSRNYPIIVHQRLAIERDSIHTILCFRPHPIPEPYKPPK